MVPGNSVESPKNRPVGIKRGGWMMYPSTPQDMSRPEGNRRFRRQIGPLTKPPGPEPAPEGNEEETLPEEAGASPEAGETISEVENGSASPEDGAASSEIEAAAPSPEAAAEREKSEEDTKMEENKVAREDLAQEGEG